MRLTRRTELFYIQGTILVNINIVLMWNKDDGTDID